MSKEGVPRSCGWVEESFGTFVFRQFATRSQHEAVDLVVHEEIVAE